MSGIFKPISPKYYDTSNSLTTGLVFDAQLYEGSGTTALDLANSVSGTLTNSPTWGSRNPYGYKIAFTDSTNQILYTSVAAQNSLTTISVETLCYPTAENAANDSRIIHKHQKYFSLAYASTNKFEFAVAWTTTEGDWDTPAFTANNWYHVVTTYDMGSTANNPIIYVNNVSQSVTRISTPAGSAPTDSTTIVLGNRTTGEGAIKGFVGDIAYVRYWNRILTATEVGLLYSNPWRIYAMPQQFNSLRPRAFAPGIAR